MNRHELKTWAEYFQSVWEKKKQFEIRKNDRDYQVGDQLILKEFYRASEKYTGRVIVASITYFLEGEHLGIKSGYCILGIEITAVGREQNLCA